MYFAVISLFPQMFDAICQYGITARALHNEQAWIECINPRDFVSDNYRRIDDRPFGGGAGMVMMAEPLMAAITHAKQQAANRGLGNIPVVYLSPQGQVLNESSVQSCLSYRGMILLCGRYDGIDERVLKLVDVELSIGDYVLTGGELPAMVLMDSLIRRLPDVMGDDMSAVADSFVDGLLDYPQYTRPVMLNGDGVPEVLLSGHHQKIEQWRFEQKLDRTKLKRPDLYHQFVARMDLPKQEQRWLQHYLAKTAE